MRSYILALALILFLFPFASSAHYVFGYVNNSYDGESANGKTAYLWRPSNPGLFLTDTVGTNGNSGADNIYMIDCEMLATPCKVGDVMSIRISDGNRYITEVVNISVASAGYTQVPNLRLNSPPQSFLINPNQDNFYNSEIVFNCSVSDFDSNLESVTLFGNWSGWHANETKSISGEVNHSLFVKSLPHGRYSYNCLATDNLSISSFASSNVSFSVDTINPEIYLTELNKTYSCGTSESVSVSCYVLDYDSGIGNVTIEAIRPSGIAQSYPATFILGDIYSADILLDELGEWNFNCIAEDKVGNTQTNNTDKVSVYSYQADIHIENEYVYFFGKLAEKEVAIINLTIENKGCGDANNFIVGLYEDDFGSSIENKTISLPWKAMVNLSFEWTSKIGKTRLIFFADSENIVTEFNESNNIAEKLISVGAWQTFFGNLSVDKILGSEDKNITLWYNQENLTGNIFITNKESNINWNSLHAIGKTTNNQNSFDDFDKIDFILNMGAFDDSVNKTFFNGTVNTENFLVHSSHIYNVPVFYYGDSRNFFTGVLWDKSKDTNGYFDLADKEDIVFVSKVSHKTEGNFGNYDYEITVPVLLRNYYSNENEELYFYYDLN
jgi:hypothetical protein